jgi:PAS domain S-box-containing protein
MEPTMSQQQGDPSARTDPLGLLTESTLRIFVNSVRDYAILMLDPMGHVISWNPGAEAIKGWAAHEIIGSHFSRFYPPESLASGLPQRELTEAAAIGRFEDEGWRLRKDGSRFWANVIITALRDETGKLIGYAKLTRDLTERRRQEEALKLNEERFRSLVEGVKDYAIVMLDPKGVVATWNAGAEQIKGYTAQEIIGSHFSRFYPVEAIKRGMPDHELRVATMEGRFEDEGWRLRKDGSRFWANVIITSMRDASGKLTGFSKITRDLTQRKADEVRVRESEERFRLLVDGVTDHAIFMLDDFGAVSSWNAGAERILGYHSGDILGRHFSHFFTAEDIAANKPWQHLMTARDVGHVTEEGWRVRGDRILFWAGSTLTALYDPSGRSCGFAMVTQDLTERRHAKSLAEAAERMHEFIAMLAHELRNPLAPIRNAVALMGRRGLEDPTLESMRETIDRQSTHLTRLLDELLDVNRNVRGQLSIDRIAVDLRDILARSVEASRPLIEAHGHRLHLDLPPVPLVVAGDDVRLTQVFINLLNNAAKYTPDGGDIFLRATSQLVNEIEVQVSDSGKGIARDQLERVFELFVQVNGITDGATGGLGVGLALVRKVVELHGGHVEARSDGLGKGSEFVVRLPSAETKLSAVEVSAPQERQSARRVRVLIVDDNRDAANSLELLIRSMGHEVRAVYDGPSAVALLETLQPQLVLLDIGMPMMSGYDVARQIRSHHDTEDSCLLVAVTGWGQETDRKRAREAGFDRHFVKPVSQADIASVLREAQSRPTD